MDAYLFAGKIPCFGLKIPYSPKILPDKLRRELREKSLQRRGFSLWNWLLVPWNCRIPCIFPCSQGTALETGSRVTASTTILAHTASSFGVPGLEHSRDLRVACVGGSDMRTFLGMVLGCLLTIGVVYVHDSMATSTVASGASAGTSRQIVNWDVAASEWGQVKENVRTTWLKLKASNS